MTALPKQTLTQFELLCQANQKRVHEAVQVLVGRSILITGGNGLLCLLPPGPRPDLNGQYVGCDHKACKALGEPHPFCEFVTGLEQKG